MHTIRLFIYLLLFLSCTTNKEVDLIVYNAKIYTVDSTFAVADAFVVNNGVFVEVGRSEDLLSKYRAEETINAQQRAIYPGFYDMHGHFFKYANVFEQVEFNSSNSFDEIILLLQNYHHTHPDKKWIVARGHDQELWLNNDIPSKDSLDKYFPDIPILLSRIDNQVAVVNSKALEMAGIDSAYVVSGGTIAMDSIGKPNGILLNNAVDLANRHIPMLDEKTLYKTLNRIQDSLLSVGLTSIVDIGLSEDEVDQLRKIYNEDSLQIRSYAVLSASSQNIQKLAKYTPFESEKFSSKAVNVKIDVPPYLRHTPTFIKYSTLDSLSPSLIQVAEFENLLKILSKTSLQVLTEAYGADRISDALHQYNRLLRNRPDKRWLLHNPEGIDSTHISLFKNNSILASIQIRSKKLLDSDKAKGLDDAQYGYYKQVLNTSGKISIGSNFPMAYYNPLYEFLSMISLEQNHPKHLDKNEFLFSRQDVLKAMTIWAAYACHQDKKRGSIEKGKDADFVILSDDIMVAKANTIQNIKTLRTVIAGKTVFERNF